MADGPLSVEDLLEDILGTVAPLSPVLLPLLDAAGLVTCEPVDSPLSLPVFDNSAMDGYAVRAAEVASATVDDPVVLPVSGEIGAGRGGVRTLLPGSAAKIMTGAPVPAGADAVVPYEWTDRGVDSVTVRQAPAPGQHVRTAGEDVEKGDPLLDAGVTLTPRHLGLLAAVGLDRVLVRPRPRLVVLSTGSELRAPGEPLGPDGIYDANTTLLAAAARAAGAEVLGVGVVADEPSAFLAVLTERMAGADLVVTSGGVSQGDYDVVKESLRSLGGMWFGAVAMQPGKPQGFGTVGDAAVFCLPGNPVSAYVSFQVFVVPALRRLAGLLPYVRPLVTGVLTTSVRSPAGRRQFLRAAYDAGSVTPVGGPGSHLLGGLAGSDALVVVPEDVTELPAGAEVQVLRLVEES